MPLADTTASFLHGLSDLWLKFFQDKNQLEAMARGEEVLIGQAYMDLLDNVLNLSQRETPLYSRDYYRLLAFREDEVTFNPTINRYVVNLPDNIKAFDTITNKVFDPTATLRSGVDYEVVIDEGDEDELRFRKNPFDWSGGATLDTIPGFPVRVIDEVPPVRQLAMWLPDAQVDEFNLYLTYGYLLSNFSPSSEAYRALIRGVTQYFVLGPTLDHLVSALNVCSGFEVVRDDGEILTSVDTSDPLVNVVYTDQRDYTFDKTIPLRDDVTDTTNWGTLQFSALEPLTRVYTVKDHISDPTWWHNIIVPADLTYDPVTQAPQSLLRRSISPFLYENRVDYPHDGSCVGDPGYIIGCDDDGFDPAAAGLAREPLRHVYGYILFERFLKHHVFAVILDSDVISNPDVAYPLLDQDVVEIIRAGKPAYVYLYGAGTFLFTDSMSMIDDTLELNVGVTCEDHLTAADNGLTVGVRSWSIGDYYYFDTMSLPPVAGTVITVKNESTDGPPDRSGGGGAVDPDNPVCVGGTDPTHLDLPLAQDGGVNLVTIVFDPLSLTQSIVGVPFFGNDAFHPDDVGRVFYDVDNDRESVISEYITAKSIKIIARYADIGVHWRVYNAHTGVAARPDAITDGCSAEWALSIRVN